MISEIDVVDAMKRVDRGEGRLLDVRENAEWQAGHATQAIHIPMSELDLSKLSATGPVVVICRVGGRSAHVAQALATVGIDAVNIDGGMAAWEAAGQPVVGNDGKPGTVI